MQYVSDIETFDFKRCSSSALSDPEIFLLVQFMCITVNMMAEIFPKYIFARDLSDHKLAVMKCQINII